MSSSEASRQRVLDVFKKRIPTLSETDIQNIEKGIYNWSLEKAEQMGMIKSWNNEILVQLYVDKARSVVDNLAPNSYLKNTRLLVRLEEGEFQGQDLSSMFPHSIYPEKWVDILDKKMKREQKFHDTRQIAKTDKFRCSKCRKRECNYYEMQIRSADESSTIFVSCLNCGYRWRIG
jgi:DNA-directed RNA polymerase subunit M/transcription elongation factor TFIIS